MKQQGRIGVLFVCLGNICRSPAAEAIFTAKVKELGLEDKFFIDSAGLNGYHNGERADVRMIRHASLRGYKITSISRKVVPSSDFVKFDIVIGMDNYNIKELKRLSAANSLDANIVKMTDFGNGRVNEVPDPYYGGAEGFERVLDILEESTEGLLKFLRYEEFNTTDNS